MIKKTNNSEIITHLEAQEKYAGLYFSYVEIERKIYQPDKKES